MHDTPDHFPIAPPPRAWLTPPSRDFTPSTKDRAAPAAHLAKHWADQPEDGEIVRAIVIGCLCAVALFGVFWAIGTLTVAEHRALGAEASVQP